MATGYCVKCKQKGREIKNGKEFVMKTGMKALRGNCAVCDTKMVKILGKA